MHQQKRLEQIKYQVQDPESNSINNLDTNKFGQTKKKGFKVKKNRNFSLKKLKNIDIFNNPIYAGLQNQQKLDQHQNNFGPWIHQDIILKQQKLRNAAVNEAFNQNLTTNNNIANAQRVDSINDVYLEIPMRNAILQDTDHTQISYLPQIQIKQKRQIHELRTSSLDFVIQNNQIKKKEKPSLSPPKTVKYKMGSLTRNKSQTHIINNLKYDTLNQYPSYSKILGMKFESKPSKVIYNYCYSNNQNNAILNYFKDGRLNVKDNNNNSQNSRDLYSAYKMQRDETFLKKLSKNDQKNNKKYDICEYLQPLKQSISKQLYEDLLKKKKKCR